MLCTFVCFFFNFPCNKRLQCHFPNITSQNKPHFLVNKRTSIEVQHLFTCRFTKFYKLELFPLRYISFDYVLPAWVPIGGLWNLRSRPAHNAVGITYGLLLPSSPA